MAMSNRDLVEMSDTGDKQGIVVSKWNNGESPRYSGILLSVGSSCMLGSQVFFEIVESKLRKE